MRATYQADAGYLTRLAQAIEIDTGLLDDDKHEVLKLVNELAILLIRINEKKVRREQQ